MLYLAAAELPAQFMDEYNGEKGKFIKTFALNDKRNKNGWRVTWPSIKKNIPTFLDDGGRPGIEYMKCEEAGCDLDHTEGATFEQSLEVQEPFRVTNIIDYQLDESTHTAYFIHKANDDEFYEKVQKGKIKFVSPAIWPQKGGYVVLGVMPNGLPEIDVYEWKGLHDAFVNKPAFGDDAEITATCEGQGCHMRLLTAAEHGGEMATILLRHRGKLTFVSVPQLAAKEITALATVTESEVLPIIRGHFPDSSFSSCACKSGQMPNPDDKDKELAAMKKAAEDKDEEIKELKSKLAAAQAQVATTPAAQTAATKDAGGAGQQSAKEENEQIKAMKATISSLQTELKQPLIAKMVEAREKAGASEVEIKEFKASLKDKSFEEIKAQSTSEDIFYKNLTAKADESKTHFEFNGGQEAQSALTAKSLEEIFGEVA